ncbi:DUF6602 domain-containing protein [Streptomyces sp. NPDC029044]|uniref:DUF6602 domain-containing protein n=1 Tax=Streptomyces sp. NPDC029044 TaxID=3157198 RepID=UPI0033EB57AD
MTQELNAEYERLRVRAREDPGTAGQQGEETWARLLREWLPSGYQVVTGGRILDSAGNTSPQLDVIVLHPSYPPGLLKLKYFLAPAVVAAFECKLTLKSSHIKKCAHTAALIESMAVAEGRPAGELFFGVLAHTHSWKSAASSPVKNIQRALMASTEKYAKLPGEAIDSLCVADLASWTGFCAEDDDSVLRLMHMTQAWGFRSRVDAPEPITQMMAHLLDRIRDDAPGVGRIADYLRNIGSMGTTTGKFLTWNGLPSEKKPIHAFRMIWAEEGVGDFSWIDELPPR